MTGSFDIAVTGYANAARALERSLAETRPQWDDNARLSFDRQHADPLLADIGHTTHELNHLAQELNAAARLLANSA